MNDHCIDPEVYAENILSRLNQMQWGKSSSACTSFHRSHLEHRSAFSVKLRRNEDFSSRHDGKDQAMFRLQRSLIMTQRLIIV